MIRNRDGAVPMRDRPRASGGSIRSPGLIEVAPSDGGQSARVAEHVQRVPQIVRVVADEPNLVLRTGVDKAELARVQPLAAQSEPGGQGRIGAVREIADAR